LLTRPISQNAVFFSVYVVFGILFLLAPYGQPVIGGVSPRARNFLRVFLLLFFLGVMVLLNSKLLLLVALVLLIHALLRRYSFRRHKGIVTGAGIVVVAAVILVSVTNNPVSLRFRDMKGDLTMVNQPAFNPNVYFNPLQLRLLEWRFASEILQEHKAWLIGVSPGDYQDLLDQKYTQMHMYIGDTAQGPHRHIRGFIGYNSHNQYLETFMRSGVLGLACLLAIFAAFFAAARRCGMREPWFVVLILAVFFVPEAPLTMQHGVFLFAFFPFLALAFPHDAAAPAPLSAQRP
jgi:O-antigen ligase